MKEPIIQLKGVCKAFSGNMVLKNIDLTVNPGEVLCLCGENGCGKSTLIKIISGVYEFDAGQVMLNGRNYQHLTPMQSIDEGIQVIYQDFSVFSNLTVAENIAVGYRVAKGMKGVSYSFNRRLAKEALDMIGVDIDPETEVERLSVAQKQLVAISRAVCQDARLIIMDEPTSAITQKEIEKLFSIIRSLKSRGISVMFVSHKLDEIMTVCDRIAVIRSGEKVIDLDRETFPRDKLVYYMTGKEIQEEPFAFTGEDKPLLTVENASREGEFENVSFFVRTGEILAITGQLGCGRTELAKALFGLSPIQSGRILIDGKPVDIKSQKDALEAGIAYLPEDRLTEGLFLSRSLGDNFSCAIIDTMKDKMGLIPEKAVEELSGKWMNQLNMDPKPYTTPASSYSGGNQQRIVLGKWLAVNPRIFILNCPTVGVDVKSKSEIHQIIKQLASQGMTILLISDDVGEIMTTSNRLLIMNNGRVVFGGDTASVQADEIAQRIVSDTFGGLDNE